MNKKIDIGFYNRLVAKCFSFLSRIIYANRANPVEPPTGREQRLIMELRDAIRNLPAAISASDSISEKIWIDYTNRLRHFLLHEDPRKFLRWDIIQHTMFCNAPYCYLELRHLRGREDWARRWRPAICEDKMGWPQPFLFYRKSSGNLIHHAYHLSQFEERLSVKISDIQLIFEFGGGYGSMSRLIHRLNYHGAYVIYDLPNFSALQTFFLQGINLPVCSRSTTGSAVNGIICTDDIHELRKVVSNIPEKSLFISAWSISEAPQSIRQEIMDLISSFSYFLIAYADAFGEVNNVAFFQEWRHTLGENIMWFDFPIKHLPGNRYLFGTSFNTMKDRMQHR